MAEEFRSQLASELAADELKVLELASSPPFQEKVRNRDVGS